MPNASRELSEQLSSHKPGNKVSLCFYALASGARPETARVFGAAFSDGVHLSARNGSRAVPFYPARVGNVRIECRGSIRLCVHP